MISCGAAVCFSFNTTPQIVSINPGVIVTGGSSVQLTIVGSNFGNNTVVVLSDGTQIVPATIGPTSMTILLGSSFFSSTGTIAFRVSNPCGGFSNTVVITVVDHF
jgi:hypothetical protein